MASIETLTSIEIQSKVLEALGPVALDFYQESCPPCRVFGPRLERMAERYEGQMLCIAWMLIATYRWPRASG